MRKQKLIWEREHQTQLQLPNMSLDKPRSSVLYFLDFIQQQSLKLPLRVLDIGCGNGRNLIYIAKKGFEVFGLDFVEESLKNIKQRVIGELFSNRIKLRLCEIDKNWPFPDNYFSLAIDCFSSIDIETKKGRDIYKREMYRTLKPHGYVLVTVVSSEDELEKELIKKYPGKEVNSSIWPESGKFQKNYSEEELRTFYNNFKIIELREVKTSVMKLGKSYIATNYWIILQKQNLI